MPSLSVGHAARFGERPDHPHFLDGLILAQGVWVDVIVCRAAFQLMPIWIRHRQSASGEAGRSSTRINPCLGMMPPVKK
jgi:hypothetical protein